MRNILVAIALVMSLPLSACSDDDGGDVCTQAYNKGKQCADTLDCASITDAVTKATCETVKKAYSMSYADAKAACEKANPGQCECTGVQKTAAESYLGATLDPKTCTTLDSTSDQGAIDDNPDMGFTPDTVMTE